MKKLFTVIALFVAYASTAQKVQIEPTVGFAKPLLPTKHREGYIYHNSYMKVATGFNIMMLVRDNQCIGLNISRYGVYYDATTPTGGEVVDWVGSPMYNFALEIRTRIAQLKYLSIHASPRVGILYDTGVQGINLSAKATIQYKVSSRFGILINSQIGFNSFNQNISRNKRGRQTMQFFDYSCSGGVYIKI